VLAWLVSTAGAQEPSRFIPWTRETPALALRDLGGRSVSLDDYRGKVVLVNFWATWCEPCREEMPSMRALQQRLAGQPFDVVTVNYGESPSRVTDFLAREKLELTVLLDPGQQAARAWRVRVLPGSFLVGRDGRVRFSVIGELDWLSEEAVRVVRGLLGPRAERRDLARGLAAAQDPEQALLQLGGDRRLAQGLGGIDGAAVRVHEGDAGRAALDVPLDQLAGLGREGAADVVAEKLGDLAAFHPGVVAHGLHYMLMADRLRAILALTRLPARLEARILGAWACASRS
jgi:thiol-disulfide isomerase/thioredoxin